MNRKRERGRKMAIDRKGKTNRREEEVDREREGGDAELYRSLLFSVRDVTDVPHQR